jgi:hypothetical protein
MHDDDENKEKFNVEKQPQSLFQVKLQAVATCSL